MSLLYNNATKLLKGTCLCLKGGAYIFLSFCQKCSSTERAQHIYSMAEVAKTFDFITNSFNSQLPTEKILKHILYESALYLRLMYLQAFNGILINTTAC